MYIKAITEEPSYHCPRQPDREPHEPVCAIVKLAGGKDWLELGLRCEICGRLLDKKRLPATVKRFG